MLRSYLKMMTFGQICLRGLRAFRGIRRRTRVWAWECAPEGAVLGMGCGGPRGDTGVVAPLLGKTTMWDAMDGTGCRLWCVALNSEGE